MKKRNLLKLMVALLVLPMGARAQVKDFPPVLKQSNCGMTESMFFDQQHYRKTERDNTTILTYNNPIPQKEVTSDDAQVHFVLDYDKEGVETASINLYMHLNQQYYGDYTWDYDDEFEPVLPLGDDFTVALPKGEWDFCLVLHNNNTNRYEYVIQDQVQIDGDITLTFSEASATNHISVKELMPDGREMVFTKFRENKKGEVEVVSRGDVDELYLTSLLVYKPEGSRGGLISIGGSRANVEGVYAVKDTNVSDIDWWVSDSKSGRFAFCRAEYACEGNKFEMNESSVFYANKFYTDKTETAVLTNDPANYFYTEEKFMPSKAGKATNGQVYIEELNRVFPTGFFSMNVFIF